MCKSMALRLKVAATAALVAAAGMRASASHASNYRIVNPDYYSLGTGTASILATDTDGNLYGEGQGERSDVFELAVKSNYSKERELFVFGTGGATEGSFPLGGVTLTPKDAILGSTQDGGLYDHGTVFNLGRASNIIFDTLHAFNPSMAMKSDGEAPQSGLTAGFENKYYGTTFGGGSPADGGTVFSISVSKANPIYKIIHRFGAPGDGTDGSTPGHGRLVSDTNGDLFGVTEGGGTHALGTVFMLQNVDGVWQEQVLYSFNALNDVFGGVGNVVLDGQGGLFGCGSGGTHDQGGVYHLTPPPQPGGLWQEVVLYNFGDQANDPNAQGCGIVYDASSNLIVGTTYYGGVYNKGTLFTLSAPSGGQGSWSEAVAHSFEGGKRKGLYYKDGEYPTAPPIKVGKIYYGGNSETGSIYAFTP